KMKSKIALFGWAFNSYIDFNDLKDLLVSWDISLNDIGKIQVHVYANGTRRFISIEVTNIDKAKEFIKKITEKINEKKVKGITWIDMYKEETKKAMNGNKQQLYIPRWNNKINNNFGKTWNRFHSNQQRPIYQHNQYQNKNYQRNMNYRNRSQNNIYQNNIPQRIGYYRNDFQRNYYQRYNNYYPRHHYQRNQFQFQFQRNQFRRNMFQQNDYQYTRNRANITQINNPNIIPIHNSNNNNINNNVRPQRIPIRNNNNNIIINNNMNNGQDAIMTDRHY
ncbi:hypothetical protein RFI_37033, partial [Reticulomyxa filosa]